MNGPEVASGTVADPPSFEVTVMTCGGASTPAKLAAPAVRSPYPLTVSVAAGSLEFAATVRVAPS